MMKLISLLLFFVTFFFAFSGSAQLVSGNVQSADGSLLPFASVYLENSTYGVSTDSRGNYQIELPSGEQTLIFSFIGFENERRNIRVTDEHQVINVKLKPSASELGTAEIVGDTKARAKSIMELVREKRREYKRNLNSYSAQFYSKITLDEDSLILRNDNVKADRYSTETPDSLKKGLLLKEYYGEVNYERPGRYKEIIEAYRDYQDRVIPFSGKSIGYGFDLDRDEIAPLQEGAQNNFLIYRGFQDSEFDFYDNLIDFPGMVVKPLSSPIAAGSNLKYRFDFEGVFEENGVRIHQIRCSPLFAGEALFTGLIFVEDSTWALRAVDLEINPKALTVCKRFRIIQHYEESQ
ncbi:MAG: DUF5686 family protein, partial [Flavobacteriales bacterium]